MCRPWSKQLNWWDSISFFWFHADDWLQNDQVLWSMLEIFTVIDSPVGIVVPGSYSGFLGRLPYVLCVSGCVCLQHVLIFFHFIYLFIYSSSCLLFLPQLFVLMWTCGAAKADFWPHVHFCCTKIKSPQWLTHRATEQKGIIDSWRKVCVWVGVCVGNIWDNWRQSSRFRTGSREKKAEFSRMKRKQVTQELDKRMGSRGGRQMKWRMSSWMQIICQQGHKAAVEELTWPLHLTVQ